MKNAAIFSTIISTLKSHHAQSVRVLSKNLKASAKVLTFKYIRSFYKFVFSEDKVVVYCHTHDVLPFKKYSNSIEIEQLIKDLS